MRPVLKSVRRGEYRNPTTVHGSVVHAYDEETLVRCKLHLKSVLYSSEPVNCAKCLEVMENMDMSRLLTEVDRAAGSIHELARTITPETVIRLVNAAERIADSPNQASMALEDLATIAKTNAGKVDRKG